LERIAFGVLVAAALVMIVFFLLMHTSNDISIAENTTGSVLSPVQNAASSVTRYIQDVISGAKNYFTISQNYEDAQRQITELQLQVSALEEEAIENTRLKSLLDAKNEYDSLDPVYAKVISRNAGLWFDTFSINRGTADGVAVNMAVITGDGLVGRVYEVGLNYAKVLSIIDSRSAVACLIERTRDNGVMRGQITSSSTTSECYMYYLPAVNDVIPGDTVITSGVDTLFSKGIPVGTVTQVSRQTDSSDQYIVVEPAVDFQHIEEVLVLRTVVETDQEENLPVVPTPTPRPTVSPTPEPTPDPDATSTPLVGDDAVFQRATPMPSEQDDTDANDIALGEATPAPTPTPNPSNVLPEDNWAQG
jgi:rod shape-determining protein MreC